MSRQGQRHCSRTYCTLAREGDLNRAVRIGIYLAKPRLGKHPRSATKRAGESVMDADVAIGRSFELDERDPIGRAQLGEATPPLNSEKFRLGTLNETVPIGSFGPNVILTSLWKTSVTTSATLVCTALRGEL